MAMKILTLIFALFSLTAFGQFHNYPSTPWASTNLNNATNFDGNLTNNNGTIGLSPSASVNQATNLVGLATASIVTTVVKPYLATNITVTPEQFGGIPDGQKVSDVRYTNGSPEIWSPSGPFKIGDVGKGIALYLDISNATYTTAVITNFVDAQHVIVSTNLPMNWTVGQTNLISNSNGTNWGSIHWGTDNTPAWQAALNAIYTNNGGTLQCSLGNYCFWSNYTYYANTGQRSMLHIHGFPAYVIPATNNLMVNSLPYPINILGIGAAMGGNGSADNASGTSIFIGTPATTNNNTANNQICWLEASIDGTFTNASGEANVAVNIDGLNISTPPASKVTPINMWQNGSLNIGSLSIFRDVRLGVYSMAYFYADAANTNWGLQNNANFPPPTSSSVAFPYGQSAVIFPGSCNNANCSFKTLQIEGYDNAITATENLIGDNLQIYACGSSLNYFYACGAGVRINTFHWNETYYGVVVQGAGYHEFQSADFSTEFHPATFPVVPFVWTDDTTIGGYIRMDGAASFGGRFPPNLRVDFSGGTSIGGPISGTMGGWASELGANPMNQGLIWDMPWITNSTASIVDSIPAAECFNRAYIDPNSFNGCNRIYLNSGAPPPYLVLSGFNGNACMFGPNYNYAQAYLPQATNFMTSAFTFDFLFQSTNTLESSTLFAFQSLNFNVNLQVKTYNTNYINMYLNGTAFEAVGTNLFNGSFHDIAITYDGMTCVIYYDGNAITNKAISTSLNWAGSMPILSLGGGTHLGMIGENKIWTRALAAQEIQRLFQQNMTGSTNAYIPWSSVSGSGTNNAVQNQQMVNTTLGVSNLVVNGIANGNGAGLTNLNASAISPPKIINTPTDIYYTLTNTETLLKTNQLNTLFLVANGATNGYIGQIRITINLIGTNYYVSQQ